MFLSTAIAKEIENGFGGGWDFYMFVTVFFIDVVACKAEDGFSASLRGFALVVVVSGKVTAVMETGEVTNKSADKGLARHNAEVIVDQKK